MIIVGVLSSLSLIAWFDFYDQYTEAEEDLREVEKYRNGYKNILENLVEDDPEPVSFEENEDGGRYSWIEEVEMEVEN